MGWFNRNMRMARKLIFPLTEESVSTSFLPFTDPTWGLMPNQWWRFLTDGLKPKEERSMSWQVIPQLSLAPICETNPTERLTERITLEMQPISTSFMGNCHCIKLIQVFKPTLMFNLYSVAREAKMGVLEH